VELVGYEDEETRSHRSFSFVVVHLPTDINQLDVLGEMGFVLLYVNESL